MKTLIIGDGEIGNSLYNIFKPHYLTKMMGKTEVLKDQDFEIMHIAFPYSDKFVDYVKDYQKRFKPKFTVIHSTVKIGTCRKLGAISSPVIGIHPNLTESMKTFTKFLGGEQASEVAQYFRRTGMKVYLTDKQETTELMKICSTSFYGLCIEWVKEVKRLCDKNDVPFEFWTLWTENYNKGYNQLGHPEFTRPNLVPIKTKVGGHCVLNNLQFLDSKFSKLIGDLNA